MISQVASSARASFSPSDRGAASDSPTVIPRSTAVPRPGRPSRSWADIQCRTLTEPSTCMRSFCASIDRFAMPVSRCASAVCSRVRPPGVSRYRSSAPSWRSPACRGNVNRARTPRSRASRAYLLQADGMSAARSGTVTGRPVRTASVHGPSPSSTCMSARCSASGSVPWTMIWCWSPPIRHIPAPDTPSTRALTSQTRVTSGTSSEPAVSRARSSVRRDDTAGSPRVLTGWSGGSRAEHGGAEHGGAGDQDVSPGLLGAVGQDDPRCARCGE